KPIPGRIKDYIATPKENMYQSLHTTVVTDFGKIFEIQIRTRDMNRTAEYGIAAHWKYKESKENADNFDKRLSWIREVMEWQGGLNNSTEFIESLKGDVYNSEVLVFTPNGEVISLVKDATPIDFAYRIHTEVGNKCVGANVNGKMVPLNTTLNVGDVVEITTSNASKGPSWDWLKIAKSSGAKAKIKAFFKKAMAAENEKLGKSMLENEAKNRGYNLGELLNPVSFERLSQKLSFSSRDEMYAAVGCGAVTVNQVLLKLIDYYKKDVPVSSAVLSSDSKDAKRGGNVGGVKIKGLGGLLVRFAGCCNPMPGDDIIGFISRGRGVTVHRRDCPNMRNEDKARLLEAEWTGEQGSFTASIRVIGSESAHILVIVSTACTGLGIEISSVNGRIDSKNHQSVADFTVRLNKKEALDLLFQRIKQDPQITDVFRTVT
ncbi:MAG: bifunctional (p)ppGpp synthetase/guanosine-3',5'-bis(diphosphate) 3'-pyrophosphohydrolase, partial [Clostridia bacterium]|nr:bifunctional (p)ppGpp synthetase/guanosine-3',5'-bis(diphosphate) 3'-pyrophosphohydrolase [Clostridia bacterium]